MTVLAGTGPDGYLDGTGTNADFSSPSSIGLYAAAAVLYVADAQNNRIRAVNIASAVVTSLAGGGSALGIQAGKANGVGSAATFSWPRGGVFCLSNNH